jgi:hypothetical protein
MVPIPVAGRPVLFLLSETLEAFMAFCYQKVEPSGSANFQPGSNFTLTEREKL